MNFFGTENALITPISGIVGAGMVLGSLMFRKVVANDTLNVQFSVIGSSAIGILSFIIVNNIFNTVRWALLTGLVCFFGVGFLLADLLGDGETDGGSV